MSLRFILKRQSILSRRHTWRFYRSIAAIGENCQVCPLRRLRFPPIAAVGVSNRQVCRWLIRKTFILSWHRHKFSRRQLFSASKYNMNLPVLPCMPFYKISMAHFCYRYPFWYLRNVLSLSRVKCSE